MMMVQISSSLLVAFLVSFSFAPAAQCTLAKRHQPQPTPAVHKLVKRQSGSGAFSDFSGSLPASISSVIATITSGTETAAEPTPKSTYTSGATNPSISNAPPLPDVSSVVIADFPQLDESPDQSLALSKQFLSSINFDEIPDIPQTDGTCSGQSATDAAKNHWWTCGGYTTSSDVTVCPDKNTWGLSYDDGPSPYTPQLLDYLEEKSLKTTFFIVGSRALSRPAMIQYQYMTGHQLSVHTWSHPYLTTLTNEQIVMELAWTKEIIKRITGVTPLTMRPPYGDIDDRVRNICKQLNLTPIIWTSLGANDNYDTNDWRIGAGEVSAATVVQNFEYILNNASQLDTGYIVLEHDLYKQSVELAVDVVLPAALSHEPKQTLEPIVQCLNLELGDSYVETNRNISGSGGVESPDDSNPSKSSDSNDSGSGTGNLGTGSSSKDVALASYPSQGTLVLVALAAMTFFVAVGY